MQTTEASIRVRLGKGVAVIVGLSALLLAPSIMPKNPPMFTWNTTNSVPIGLYKRVDQRDAYSGELKSGSVYVTFCLPKRLRETSFYHRFCSPDAPHQARILKRLLAVQTSGGLLVQGDTDTSLDSRVLGAIQDTQIDGYWRPFFTFGGGR